MSAPAEGEMADSATTVNIEMYQILVIGKTGNGKSATCNTILGGNQFQLGRSMSSTTLRAQYAHTFRDGVQIKVVDTPDLSSLEMSRTQMKQEVGKWRELTAPGPSAVLLTVRSDIRYTPEEYDIYRQIKQLWGSDLTRRLVVAFTFGDRQDQDLEEELKVVCPELKSVLRDASGRYVVFNNKGNNKDWQTKQLLNLIHMMQIEVRRPFTCGRLQYVLCGTATIAGLCIASFVTANKIEAAVGFGVVFAAAGLGLVVMTIARRRN